MKTALRCGSELELHLIDQETGRIRNLAPEVLSELQKTFPGSFSSEPGQSTIEIVTEPHTSGKAHAADLRAKVKAAQEMANARGASLMPATVMAEDEIILPTRNERYDLQRSTARDASKWEVICDHNGIHTHISTTGDARTDARIMNMQTLAHPASLALLSTSPIWRGRNHRHNYRLAAMQTGLNRYEPFFGSLHPYLSTMDDYEAQQDSWTEKLIAYKRSIGVADPLVERDRLGGLVRSRPRKGTIEYRGADTNLPSAVTAEAMFRLGLANIALDRDMVVSSTYAPGSMLRADAISLPPFAEVYAMAKSAARTGMRSAAVRSLAEELIDVSAEGLPYEERPYLAPLRRALEMPAASHIMMLADALGPDRPHYWGPEKARLLQRSMADALAKDIDSPGPGSQRRDP